MSDALKRIEEKHLMRYAASWPTVARCHHCVSNNYPCDVVKLARALDALAKDYEALLTTLAPSKSSWVQHIHRNAKAHYQMLNPRGVLAEVAGGGDE